MSAGLSKFRDCQEYTHAFQTTRQLPACESSAARQIDSTSCQGLGLPSNPVDIAMLLAGGELTLLILRVL